MKYTQLMHQGIANPSHSMANKGGGSGSPYYENMDRLYGAQSRAAEFMLDQSMPRLPGYMQNTQDMTTEAMSGALGNRLRDRAGADADAAAGNALNAMNQNLASYGVNPNSGLFAGQNRKLAVSNAANKTSAMNQAGLAAEDMKWNRNAGALAQATGMGTGSMSQMSSAAGGYGGMASQMAGQDAANAQGFGQFGAAMAKSAFADGGEVKLANGGNAWEQYKAQNKLITGGVRQNSVNPWMAVAAGAAPVVIGKGVKAAWNSDVVQDNVVKPAKEAISNTFKSAWDKMTSPGDATAPVSGDTVQPATDTPSVTESAPVAENVVDSAPLDEGVTPIAETVVEEVALGPVADIGAEYGKEWLSDLGTEALSGGFAWADGGEVKMARGGMLNMSNAKAMKMPSVSSMDASGAMKVSSKPTTISMPKVAKMSAAPEKETASPGDAVRGGRDAYNSMEGASGAADMTTSGGEAVTQQTAEALGEAGLEQGSKQAAAIAAQDAGFEQAAEGTGMGGAASAVKGVIDIANGRDAGEAAADAAASYAGSQAGQAIGTAVAGPVGTVIGGALGGLLGGSLFAEGGDVEREDFRPGGDVQGPGTETSDDIPAWLSNGEVVENADAVKMPAEETKAVIDQWEQEGGSTKDLLLAINEEGLKKRNAFACGGVAKHGVKLAGGGFLGGNLGIALGAGVNQWQRMNEEDRRASAEKRQQEMFDRQTAEMDEKKAERTALKAATKSAGEIAADSQAVNSVFAELPGRVKRGEITQSEADAARSAYVTSNYSPNLLAAKAGSEIGKVDVVAGNAFRESINAQNANDALRKLSDDGIDYKTRRTALGTVDPKAALTIESQDLRNEENNALRGEIAKNNNETRMELAYLKGLMSGGGGRGGSGGAGGSSDKSGTVNQEGSVKRIGSQYDWSKQTKVDDPEMASNSYRFYNMLMDNNRIVGETGHSQAIGMAQALASGKIKPVIMMDPKTLGFSEGITDERGTGKYTISRMVDPVKAGSMSDAQRKETVTQVLSSVKESSPQEYSLMLALAANPKRLNEEFAKARAGIATPEQQRIINGANYLIMYGQPKEKQASERPQSQSSGVFMQANPEIGQAAETLSEAWNRLTLSPSARAEKERSRVLGELNTQ